MSPEKIGRYQIRKELGRGGMATVYQAYDPNFERDVALKVLPRAFLHDPQFRTRFEREAKTVATLEHSAIVPVYDFGEDDGQPYIVMRMMSGGDLSDKLKQGALSYQEAGKIILRLADALDAAHSKGIIHRDLKPGNILFDQYNNAYLSDFGIARLAHGGHTLTGENIIGTPAYMSPEQVQGEKGLDGRSDLYALGIIFYHMLTGHTPFQATTPAKVMMMHILEPVPNITTLNPEIPAEIDLWLQKLLLKDPDERFANAAEMSAALQLALRGERHATLQATPVVAATRISAQATAEIAPPPSTPPPHTPPPFATPVPLAAAKPKRNLLPLAIGAFLLFGVGAAILLATAFMGYRGQGPLAMLASPTMAAIEPAATTEAPLLDVSPTSETAVALATNTPAPAQATATAAPPTDTPEPTFTPAPELPTLGGADKIAFIETNNIWVMNVDGSDLEQITFDGTEKADLSWTPDGSALTYISGKCIWLAEYETGRLDYIACFETASELESFAISPDSTQAAIAINRELYIVPFDKEQLQVARFSSDLRAMSECETYAPMVSGAEVIIHAKVVRWSEDGSRLSIMLLAALNGIQGDLIKIYETRSCQVLPDLLDEFPPPRFDMENFKDTPYIQNFGYDGNYLYAITSYTRNDGFGQLYLYNSNLHRADTQVNPINGKCCYRDPAFSPDGHYLIFAHQPYEAGAASQLYLVSVGSIGTSAQYEPIPLPEGFLTGARIKPQPVLRPTQ